MYVCFDQMPQLLAVKAFCHIFERYLCLVQSCVQIVLLVENVGNTAGHSGCKILASASEYGNPATGHVFTAVIAHALADSGRTGVADAEALAGNAVDVGFTGGRTVKCNVAGDDVFFSDKFRILRRKYRQLSAG